MLKKLFDYDNPVSRFFIKLGYIWWLDILWLITSLPVFTLGASTTALVYSCIKLHDDSGYPTSNFFHSFRENFRQGTALFFIYGITGALIALDLVYWNHMDNTDMKLVWALTIVVLIPYCLSLIYVFAVQAKFIHTVKGTIYYAFMLSIKHFPSTLQLLLIMAAVIYLNAATIILANYITLFFGTGLTAYIMSAYYIRVFKNYIPAETPDPSQDKDDSRDSEA